MPLSGLLILVIMVLLIVFEVRQRQGSERAAQMVATFEVQPLGDIGATKTLRILPLLEYYAADSGLVAGGWPVGRLPSTHVRT